MEGGGRQEEIQVNPVDDSWYDYLKQEEIQVVWRKMVIVKASL